MKTFEQHKHEYIQKLKKWAGPDRWQKFLNYNYEKFLQRYPQYITESKESNPYPRTYLSYLRKHYIHPHQFVDLYTYHNYQLGIYEALHTHDIRAFIKKLKQYLLIFDVSGYEEGTVYVQFTINDYDDIQEQKLKNLCRLYGYYIFDIVIDGPIIEIGIETTYGLEEKTNYVYKQCNGILYHITEPKFKNKILKIGLISKHLDKKVSHPGRIYCVCDNDIQEMIKLGNELHGENNFIIFKIDLKKHPLKENNQTVKLKFFTDPAYVQSGVFTCENIPPQCLEIYYPDKFLN